MFQASSGGAGSRLMASASPAPVMASSGGIVSSLTVTAGGTDAMIVSPSSASPAVSMASSGGTGTSIFWPTFALAGTLTPITAPGTFGCGMWIVVPGSPAFTMTTVDGPSTACGAGSPLPLAGESASAGFAAWPTAFMASSGGTGTSIVWPTLALAGTLTKMTAPGTFGCGIWTVAPGSPRFMVMTVFGPGGTNGLLDSFQSLGGRTGRSFFVPLLICTILFKSKIYSCPRDRTFSSSEPAIRARFKTLSSSASRSFHSAPSFT
mmetsp:Transcript_129125/g.237583  ORF Transcript_129125/g.237583 Transcript_129125/m.237583 type:complete len:264 (+) Transcript_129125:83-874(+)